jgi:hypothetical protein
MEPRYPENSTDAQLKSIREFNASRTTFLGILRAQLADARVAADVKLPLTNERGNPVKHACRMEALALVSLYETQIQNLLRIDGQDRLIEHGGLALATDGKWAM